MRNDLDMDAVFWRVSLIGVLPMAFGQAAFVAGASLGLLAGAVFAEAEKGTEKEPQFFLHIIA